MTSIKTVTKTHTKTTNAEKNWVPNANEISIATVVNLLVAKGICTADEIFITEGKIRDEKVYNNSNNSYINVNNPYDRGRFPGLKKSMSKRRWSRKIGSLLFGWKWKRVKVN